MSRFPDIRCFCPSFAIRNSTTLSRLTTKADKTKKTNKTKKVEHNKEKGGRGLVILGPRVFGCGDQTWRAGKGPCLKIEVPGSLEGLVKVMSF